MTLTPEQKQAVATWVKAGDNLSTIQSKLASECGINLTYRDVRFLVDDLGLELKDQAPKVDASDLSRAQPAAESREQPAQKGLIDKAKEKLGLGAAEQPGDLPAEDLEDAAPAAGGSVRVDVDAVSLIPGALASGSVTFSDGVTGKWVVDQYGRPGFSQISKPGYRPSPEDSQAFIQSLSEQLQRRGF
jgi:hypothetical protein